MASCDMGNTQGKLIEYKGYFSEVYSCSLESVPSAVTGAFSGGEELVLGKGDNFTNGNICSAFRQKGGGQKASTVSQWSLAQNNSYAKAAYLGAAYSDPPPSL